jgi:hypothetical protein
VVSEELLVDGFDDRPRLEDVTAGPETLAVTVFTDVPAERVGELCPAGVDTDDVLAGIEDVDAALSSMVVPE